MRTATPAMEVLIQRLAEALDDEAAHLNRRRVQLRNLCDCIVERDEPGLERMLEEIERAMARQLELDDRLEAIRLSMVEALWDRPDRLTIGGIVERLDEPARSRLAGRRRQLIEAIEAFQHQHLRTSVLLLESVQVNRMLLEAVFPHSQGVTTYRAGRQDPWRPDTGVVDAER